jgi:tetratricopeptide (TPR) repeat protein
MEGANTEDEAYNQGIRFFLDGQYDRALQVWNRLLASSPDRSNLREYIEKAEKMKLQEEIASLKLKQMQQNDKGDRLIRQGYTLYRLGQTDKAITLWERALAIDPSSSEAASALKEARAKRELLKGQDSIEASSKVEELNSEAMNAYVTGDLGRASLLLRKAIAVDPRNARVRNNLERIESELASKNLLEAQ